MKKEQKQRKKRSKAKKTTEQEEGMTFTRKRLLEAKQALLNLNLWETKKVRKRNQLRYLKALEKLLARNP